MMLLFPQFFNQAPDGDSKGAQKKAAKKAEKAAKKAAAKGGKKEGIATTKSSEPKPIKKVSQKR